MFWFVVNMYGCLVRMIVRMVKADVCLRCGFGFDGFRVNDWVAEDKIGLYVACLDDDDNGICKEDDNCENDVCFCIVFSVLMSCVVLCLYFVCVMCFPSPFCWDKRYFSISLSSNSNAFEVLTTSFPLPRWFIFEKNGAFRTSSLVMY